MAQPRLDQLSARFMRIAEQALLPGAHNPDATRKLSSLLSKLIESEEVLSKLDDIADDGESAGSGADLRATVKKEFNEALATFEAGMSAAEEAAEGALSASALSASA